MMKSLRLAMAALSLTYMGSAFAVDASASLGTVTGTQYFTNSPAAGSFNDTYSFSVSAGQSILAGVRARNATFTLAGTEFWSLSFTLTDAQGHFISNGSTDVHAAESNITRSTGMPQFPDTYIGTGLTISATDLSAGQYHLHVYGTKTLNTLGQEIALSKMYQGELLTYPSGSQANTLAFYAALTGYESPEGAISPTPIPEPSTLALLGLGLGAIGVAARRQRGR
ncbi:MAG: hypothetical protein C0487_14185 [Leptothrix sp. (in: Bacteria)]|nr:hypothetical protein [Leptothrix sp. (in: b-proteobacteria)]